MSELLAKSGNEEQNILPVTLKKHIQDCLLVLSSLKRAFPEAAVLSGQGEYFWEILKICVIFHDLGKAHKEFQKLLKKRANSWNEQRHEFFSFPFIHALPGMNKEWMRIISLAVLGHHKDFSELRSYLHYYKQESNFGYLLSEEEEEDFETTFRKNVDTEQIRFLLKEFSVELDQVIPASPAPLIQEYYLSPFKPGEEKYMLLMLLIGGLKWCDHAGSAQVKEIPVIECPDFDFLTKKREKLLSDGFDFYFHQKACSKENRNVILTAPTGSGKTESAFLWLKSQFRESKKQGRVFYILPFTASINAMYERLKKETGENKVGLLHGKLNDYLNTYLDDIQYTREEKKKIKEIREKFRGLLTPIKVVTPFQLLKHLFGLKGYEKGLFEMAGCYLIFDEIHAYNPEVFAQVKTLIEFSVQRLHAKAMVMTATMPCFIHKEIKDSLDTYTEIKAGKKVYDVFKRHRIILKAGILYDSCEDIISWIRKGEKVLVVCNTVKSAQQAFFRLKNTVPEGKAFLLHSSFTGKDRNTIEKKLMQDEITLLVGTQAIEVSLDIDYTVIFSEPAPLDALIQRFGRINRRRLRDVCDCFVFRGNNPEDNYMYDPSIISKTLKAVEMILENEHGLIQENLLQKYMDYVYPTWTERNKEKFERKHLHMQYHMQNLSPMMKNKHTEEEFYKQFDGIKILPQTNKEIFEDCLNNTDFIEAESLKIQIRKGKFMQWLQDKNIKKEIYVFEKNNKLTEIAYYMTNKTYDSHIGLLPDKEEEWILNNPL